MDNVIVLIFYWLYYVKKSSLNGQKDIVSASVDLKGTISQKNFLNNWIKYWLIDFVI